MVDVSRANLMALVVLAVGGCVGPVERAPAVYHRLDAGNLGRRGDGPVLDGVIEVPPVDVYGFHYTRALVRQDAHGRLARYDRHYWVERPSRLLQEAIVDALRSAHVADMVTPAEVRANARWRVHGRLRRLAHLSAPADRAVVVELALAVVDLPSKTLVLRRTYRVCRQLNRAGVQAAVVGIDRALSLVLRNFVEDIAAANLSANGKQPFARRDPMEEPEDRCPAHRSD